MNGDGTGLNCPFYGRYYLAATRAPGHWDPPFLLIDQGGNQCALVTATLAPCALEVRGEFVDWQTCERVAAIRGDKE